MANPEFRTRIPHHLNFLIRAITPLKNTGKDWNYSDVATEAFTDWLKKPENVALIKQHKLLTALKERGIEMPKSNEEIDS